MMADPDRTAAVRRRVQELRAAGGSYEAIARAAGVGVMTVHALVNGAAPITVATGERLLAVTSVEKFRHDANGSKWRLRSLLAMGHSCTRIATAMGVHPETVRHLVNGDTRTVSAGMRDAVVAIFERWWDKTPPESSQSERIAAEQARRRAERNGWPTAMGLDEEFLDWRNYSPACGWRPATGIGVADDLLPQPASVGERRQAEEPQPDRTPGAPHPDSFLAARGWHVGAHGIYVRRRVEPGEDNGFVRAGART
ncbi:MAG: helix-turn-helix domain-containing protein [Streptosporangiaceae bacterium]